MSLNLFECKSLAHLVAVTLLKIKLLLDLGILDSAADVP